MMPFSTLLAILRSFVSAGVSTQVTLTPLELSLVLSTVLSMDSRVRKKKCPKLCNVYLFFKKIGIPKSLWIELEYKDRMLDLGTKIYEIVYPSNK